MGEDAQNLATCKKVAESVKRYLSSKGISGGRLGIDPKGESTPIDENDTEEGRAANRRVELHIVQ